ncbi:hypothetical protein C0V72_05890 [Porphyrobacter sp. TH134]|uniref:hypothetical protein n=1 Tax=Porphyrobacter sp. TH134 TaxID=2067450 RepID=UPI000C7B736A|nr:hypothetical protein [Porphyrobacter sp. TH134]PLK24104.1 hypothetical protein C0V72_05890 [Porphyrobacter sp. TH134]
MTSKKKAARIGSDQLMAGIAAASATAKTRIQKLDQQDIDGVAGGIDWDKILGTGGGTTMGMFPSEPIIGSNDF